MTCGDGKAEPHDHAGRIGLDRLVDELVELGEPDDRRQALAHLLLAEAEQGGVEGDVAAAGELGMEGGAELEDRGHLAAHPEAAAGRRDAGEDLEQRRLAGAFSPISLRLWPGGQRQVDALQGVCGR
jgi:hypothetical protein